MLSKIGNYLLLPFCCFLIIYNFVFLYSSLAVILYDLLIFFEVVYLYSFLCLSLIIFLYLIEISSLSLPCAVLSCSVMSNLCNFMDYSLLNSAHGNSPGKNIGVVCHALLQGIFSVQGSNPGLLHCSWILYHLSHQGSLWLS